MNTAINYGTRYDNNLSTAACAKRIRADIKAAIAAGDLPRIKTSVRTQLFSMGSSITVTVKDCPFPVVNAAHVVWQHQNPLQSAFHFGPADARPRFTDEWTELERKLAAIVAAYNFRGSYGSHVNFYAHINVDHDLEQGERDAALAAAADEADGNAQVEFVAWLEAC